MIDWEKDRYTYDLSDQTTLLERYETISDHLELARSSDSAKRLQALKSLSDDVEWLLVHALRVYDTLLDPQDSVKVESFRKNEHYINKYELLESLGAPGGPFAPVAYG